MKKINKYQEALEIVEFPNNGEPSLEEIEIEIESIEILRELVEKEMYIELGMELHKELSKPCYSSEDEQTIYLDLKRYYENWLAKYED